MAEKDGGTFLKAMTVLIAAIAAFLTFNGQQLASSVDDLNRKAGAAQNERSNTLAEQCFGPPTTLSAGRCCSASYPTS